MSQEYPLTAKERVEAVQRAAGGNLPYATATPHGDVRIGAIVSGSDGDVHWVDVWLVGADYTADPSFRIVNPPLATGDPLRLDPMAAVADVIGQYGGATKGRSAA